MKTWAISSPFAGWVMNLLRQVCMKLQQIFSNKFLMINIVWWHHLWVCVYVSVFCVFICPIAIAHSMGEIIKPVCVVGGQHRTTPYPILPSKTPKRYWKSMQLLSNPISALNVDESKIRVEEHDNDIRF